MAIVIKNTDGTLTTKADASFLDNLIDGLKAPVLKENEMLDSDSAFWAAVAYGTGGVVLGSMVARNRQSQGKKPLAGVFF